MAELDNDKLKLESMLGCSISRTAGVQIPIDNNLPIHFPQSTIHYELYKNHVELHIEGSNYNELGRFLKRTLPNDDISETVERSFCKYAYILKRRIEGWKDIVELGNAVKELREIVEPKLLDYCQKVSEDFELAKTLGEYYEQQKELQPYHINVIDELHANENAHTRILVQLLKYQTDGDKQILKSFLKLIPNFDIDNHDITGANLFFNRDNIDGLIEKERDFAIIIENKIHWAVDQDKQIERYVSTEIERGIPSEHIWVIYLTSDGRKQAESYSLTDHVLNILDDRYIELNYRNNILPWLKSEILPNCKLKEEWLISAIKQYIDHLEGMFGLRESQSLLRKKIQSKIEASIGCTKNMPIGETYDKLRSYLKMLGELQNIAENSIDSIVRPTIKRLESSIIETLYNIIPDEDVSFYNGMHNGFYQVFLKKWPNTVHFEFVPFNQRKLLSGRDYSLVLHVEQKDLQSKFRTLLDDEVIASKAKNAGITMYDSRTFYKIDISTNKPFAEMSTTELIESLEALFRNGKQIESFISEYLLK